MTRYKKSAEALYLKGVVNKLSDTDNKIFILMSIPTNDNLTLHDQTDLNR
jgi:hypothetical protein